MTESIGIVIPAYRPDMSLLSTYIKSLDRDLEPAEIIVELDMPQSDEIVHTLRQTPVNINVSSNRRGKGAAITQGFDTLNTDIRMFLDADGSASLTSAEAILGPIQDGTADISVGSRRHPDAEIISHQTVARQYLGDAFAWIARLILPIELFDYQCGAKALTAEAWEEIRPHLYERGFAWDFELLAVADTIGHDIVEIPITWEDRPDSTVDPIRTVFEFSRALVTVRHRALALDGHPIHRTLPQINSQPLVDHESGD